MSDDVVERAKHLLEGTTPGPWECRSYVDDSAEDERDWTTAYGVSALDHHWIDSVAGGMCQADGRFIAAAPDLVRELVAELEQMRIYEARWHEAIHVGIEDAETIDALRSEVERLKADNENRTGEL